MECTHYLCLPTELRSLKGILFWIIYSIYIYIYIYTYNKIKTYGNYYVKH